MFVVLKHYVFLNISYYPVVANYLICREARDDIGRNGIDILPGTAKPGFTDKYFVTLIF